MRECLSFLIVSLLEIKTVIQKFLHIWENLLQKYTDFQSKKTFSFNTSIQNEVANLFQIIW